MARTSRKWAGRAASSPEDSAELAESGAPIGPILLCRSRRPLSAIKLVDASRGAQLGSMRSRLMGNLARRKMAGHRLK